MFYYLYQLIADLNISGINLFRYITFRSAMAAVTALGGSFQHVHFTDYPVNSVDGFRRFY